MDGLDIRLREEEVYREFPSFLGVGSISDGEDQLETEENSQHHRFRGRFTPDMFISNL